MKFGISFRISECRNNGEVRVWELGSCYEVWRAARAVRGLAGNQDMPKPILELGDSETSPIPESPAYQVPPSSTLSGRKVSQVSVIMLLIVGKVHRETLKRYELV